MTPFEKLGAFYLGRRYDPERGEVLAEDLLYDAKDLTTHAVCVGMTGSGKTGLCLSLLEEAAIDGIPVLAIDPKGDLGNLLLSFPELRPADFAPWIDPGEAMRAGRSPEEHARAVASTWKQGLAEWGQDGERIRRFRNSCDLSIYTPGSSAGLPLNVLRSFSAPAPGLLADPEALADRVLSSVSGLLALLGIDADPVQSREHILLSTIVQSAWQAGRSLQLGDLIRAIAEPSFDKVGFFDLESFYPARERMALAMRVNALVASPSFATWMQGEALDIQKLLWTPEGKPRVSILSIAHLSDAQKMFFVTLVLSELAAWMRGQAGTSSLRAMLYMDEVFGYFPPTAEPPSKRPMLTLLKQARAYGIGCVLATQNPADLDYKGLSNTGTWFLGRLQTERDKLRVLEGLEGAAISSGAGFDRAKMEATLAGLGKRVFLMNNVHDDAPTLFHTRWAMSYLRGPLTRTQISELMAERKAGAPPAGGLAAAAAKASPRPRVTPEPGQPEAAAAPAARPVLAPEIPQFVLAQFRRPAANERLVYRPALYGESRLHWVSARDDVDVWRPSHVLTMLEDGDPDPWAGCPELEEEAVLEAEADGSGSFEELPATAIKASSYKGWSRKLRDMLYRERPLPVLRCKELRAISEPGESEGEFRARLTQLEREHRDAQIEKLRGKFSPKLARLEERIRTQQARIEKERAQFKQSSMSAVLSVGSTILGALFGRKLASAGTVRSATTTARRAGRAAQQKGDIAHAEAKLASLEDQLEELEAELQEKLAELQDRGGVDSLELTSKEIRPRKSDIEVLRVALVWTPWKLDASGRAEPLFD
ncbi:MAG: ATP-binding protein [Planctomycetota bacterium]|nr:MAG: ATP-binding protein [Planctomycetota bacterium]